MSVFSSMRSLRRLLLICLLALAPVTVLTPAAHAQTVAPAIATDRAQGRADAPVTVIAYASFTCSHCAEWFNDVYPAFKTRFVDTGRARLVFRDLPTPPQQFSMSAALIGRCSAPGKFFDVATSLFAGQATLATGGGRAWFDNAVAASGRSRPEIEACFADPARQAALNTDIEAAIAAGVNSTPSFFVNGRRLAGDPTLEALATAIGTTPGT